MRMGTYTRCSDHSTRRDPYKRLHFLAFSSLSRLVATAAGFASLPFDFFLKITGRSNLYDAVIKVFPEMSHATAHQLACRTLMLNCATCHFYDLWAASYRPSFGRVDGARKIRD